ncbi:MAG TPA: SHOCT domain-containing protein [Nitrospinota bacterium]|nr:SHOCT domain-containing protein [Nitrospinota bacterium]
MPGVIGIILIIGFFILLVFVVMFLIGWMARRIDSETKSKEATLKKKYEKGEISKEEFESMKKDLL